MLLTADGTVRYEVEPIGTIAVPPGEIHSAEGQLDLFAHWLIVPNYEPQAAPGLTRIVRRLIERTGWSNRGLAEVIGTTHPTIQAIRRGREPERRPDLAEALFNTAEVVEKISRIANGDQATLRSVLSARGSDGETPLQLLAAGAYAKAYLRALDLLNGSHSAVRPFNSRQERQPSREVGLIFDDRDE